MATLGAIVGIAGVTSNGGVSADDGVRVALNNDNSDGNATSYVTGTENCDDDELDSANSYWHFIASGNGVSFESISLNLDGDDDYSDNYVASGDLIILNHGKTDNVFVMVPAGSDIDDLDMDGSFAMISGATANTNFVLSHLCVGTGVTTPSSTTVPASSSTSVPASSSTTVPASSSTTVPASSSTSVPASSSTSVPASSSTSVPASSSTSVPASSSTSVPASSSTSVPDSSSTSVPDSSSTSVPDSSSTSVPTAAAPSTTATTVGQSASQPPTTLAPAVVPTTQGAAQAGPTTIANVLPATGSDAQDAMMPIAIALLLMGGALVLATRRDAPTA